MAIQQRFNVVFHGMLLFVEAEDHIDAYIPEIGGHDYKFGEQPFQGPGRDATHLEDFIAGGVYELKGLQGSRIRALELISPTDHMVVRADRVKVDVSKGKLFCRIRVPRPRFIRSFRAMELQEGPNKVLGKGPNRNLDASLLAGLPHLIHEAVCFSYFAPPDTEVRFEESYTHKSIDFKLAGQPGKIYGDTLCVYSQAKNIGVFNGEAHPTETNSFLFDVANSRTPTFECSFIGKPDSQFQPPAERALGRNHLRSLQELEGLDSSPTGCSETFVALV
jgi:hypothetical protein